MTFTLELISKLETSERMNLRWRGVARTATPTEAERMQAAGWHGDALTMGPGLPPIDVSVLKCEDTFDEARALPIGSRATLSF